MNLCDACANKKEHCGIWDKVLKCEEFKVDFDSLSDNTLKEINDILNSILTKIEQENEEAITGVEMMLLEYLLKAV